MIDVRLLATEAEVKLRYEQMISVLRKELNDDVSDLQLVEWNKAKLLVEDLWVRHPTLDRDHCQRAIDAEELDAMEKCRHDIIASGLRDDSHRIVWRFDGRDLIIGIADWIKKQTSKKLRIEQAHDVRESELRLNRARDLMLIDCTRRLQNL